MYLREQTTSEIRFEWDQAKNRSNLTRHGVSFETALLLFDDPQAISVIERTVDGEERWQTIGMILIVPVIVTHTWHEKEEEEIIRVISARKATRLERKAYAKAQSRTSGTD